MGGADGYSCSADAPKECTDFLNYILTKDVQAGYYKAFQALPVNKEAQGVVTEDYLKAGPQCLQLGTIRLALARHDLRPERGQRSERRCRESARW